MADRSYFEHGTSMQKMTDSSYFEHGTSDLYYDPYCDICFETKGHNIKVYGYCQDCFQFLCKDCHVFHKHVQATKQHIILRGMNMPQSQAEKPVRFEICDVHSKQVKDQFCSNHNILLCSFCSSSEHQRCSALSVEDTCKYVNASEIDELYNNLHKYKQDLCKIEPSIIANIGVLKEDKKKLLMEAQALYDKIIAKADALLLTFKTNVKEKYTSELSVLQKYQMKIQESVENLDLSLCEIYQLKGKVIDTKVFLKVHDIVSSTKKGFRNTLSDNIHTVALSMEPSQIMKDFLSASTTMGSVSRTESKISAGVIVPDIKFPAAATKPQTFKPSLPLAAIKAEKICTNDVNFFDDMGVCFISGMAILKNGNRIMVDHGNLRLKMLSQDMKIVSCLTVPDKPWDISVASGSEVVVTTHNKTLLRVGISDIQMNIIKSHKLCFNLLGIAKCRDKFVVTSCEPLPSSVKLIDLVGNVYWSLSHDKQGQPLFNTPRYVCHHSGGTSSSVLVTDYVDNSLTLVNGETGEVINRRQFNLMGPAGVTTDIEGKSYVCYVGTDEVAILSRDVSEKRILLSRRDGIAGLPQAIAYDDTAHQLIISYGSKRRSNTVDCYQLK